MSNLKSDAEIKIMKEGGKRLADIIYRAADFAVVGKSTIEINAFIADLIKKTGGSSPILGYQGYPAQSCISVNEEVVHGIPRADKILEEGDIVDIDVELKYQGLIVDSAHTFAIGKISDEAKQLMKVTKECLELGIQEAEAGKYTGDIGYIIQDHAEEQGYGVVRDLVGHGVGYSVHEDLQIPNYGERGRGVRLEVGMTMCIEPMINAGDYRTKTLDDGWTVVTADGSLSAHEEHTVAITEKGPKILTSKI